MTITDSQKKAHYKYAKKSLKRVPLDMQKTMYDQIKVAADQAKEPINSYIKKAIIDRMEREGFSMENQVDECKAAPEE